MKDTIQHNHSVKEKQYNTESDHKSNSYQPPTLYYMEIRVEQGYSLSGGGGSNTPGLGEDTWN
ncbi:MAG: hypothetical protein RR555_03350 [Bacteroidales bacterium]